MLFTPPSLALEGLGLILALRTAAEEHFWFSVEWGSQAA